MNTTTQVTTGFNNGVFSLNYQSDGKILVGGNFSQYNGQVLSSEVIRLNSDGTIDNSFNYGGPSYVYVNNVLQQTDGKVLVGLGQINGTNGFLVQRTNTNGTLDGSFGNVNFPNGGVVTKLLEQPDNKILVAGTFSDVGTIYHKLVRLDTDGSIDPSLVMEGFNL